VIKHLSWHTMITVIIKPCRHWQLQLPNSATICRRFCRQSPFSATVAVFGDSRLYSQCGQGFRNFLSWFVVGKFGTRLWFDRKESGSSGHKGVWEGVPSPLGTVLPPQNLFFFNFQEQMQGLMYFYCKTTTCGQKPGPGSLTDLLRGRLKMRDWIYRHHRKCKGGKCRTGIIGTILHFSVFIYVQLGYVTRGVPYFSRSRIFQSRIFHPL